MASKYHNRKTVIDGIAFDSFKEMKYYGELKLRKKAKDIIDFECQYVIELQPSYRRDGKTIRAIKYIADFRIVNPDFSVEIVDVKGAKSTRTDVYLLKKKMLLHKYPDIIFREVY